MTDRRSVLTGGAAAAVMPALPADGYGMIGKIVATPGRRAELARLLLAGSADMPGCRSYVVSEDLAQAETLWVAEAWESRAHHAASLKLPAVRAAIARARPLIASFDTAAELRPIGGTGLR